MRTGFQIIKKIWRVVEIISTIAFVVSIIEKLWN